MFDQFSLGQFAVVAVVVILLGLNIFSSVQIRDLQRQQSALSELLSTGQAAIAMLAYPDTETLPVNADVQNLTGSMLVDRDMETAVLVLWDLPRGASWVILTRYWLIDAGGNRISGGLFIPIEGQGYTTVTIRSPLPIGEFVGLGVTVEPWGRKRRPYWPPCVGRRFIARSCPNHPNTCL